MQAGYADQSAFREHRKPPEYFKRGTREYDKSLQLSMQDNERDMNVFFPLDKLGYCALGVGGWMTHWQGIWTQGTTL